MAGGTGAVGAIALLILGRQVLDWYWPLALFVLALGAAWYRARPRVLSRYRLAQLVDQRLGLADRLSTLVYLENSGSTPETAKTIEHQLAERLQDRDMPRAVPVVFPRYGYACAALVVAAAGLLGIRYGVLHTMDLHPPLAHMPFEPLQPEPRAYAATKKTAIQERWEQQLKELGLTPQDLEAPEEKGLKPTEAEIPAAGNDPNAATAEKQDGVKNMKVPGQEGGEDGESGDKSAAGETAENGSGESGSEQKGQGQSKQQNAPQNAKNGQQGQNQDGLMNKMRDALANLMNKLKPGQKGEQQAAGEKGQEGQSEQAQSRQNQNQQGMQSQGKQQGEGQPGADQQGQEGQDGDKMAGDKNKSGDKAADRPGSQDAKSGMGQQDGEKAIREAQQLAAMGKISEIFGKRAQQLTGEMSVEVSSGKQQLKTQWSERKALHSDTGAETNRNEIPLAYQSYIQRYFEEIRKTAPGSKSRVPEANPQQLTP